MLIWVTLCPLKRGFHSTLWACACKKILDDVKKYRIPRALGRKKYSEWKLKNFSFLSLHKFCTLVVKGNHALIRPSDTFLANWKRAESLVTSKKYFPYIFPHNFNHFQHYLLFRFPIEKGSCKNTHFENYGQIKENNSLKTSHSRTYFANLKSFHFSLFSC